jgi:hypothetical protein
VNTSGPTAPPAPAEALARLAANLREEGTVISGCVVEPAATPVLGELCAKGPRAEAAPGDYALVIESVLEGYLLHYGTPRILAGHDADLALLAGDYLYAQGIERLAALGDTPAIRELADLISLAAEARAEGRDDLTEPLWLAATIAVGCGSSGANEAAKAGARTLEKGAAEALRDAAREAAEAAGLGDPFEHAADSIDFRLPELPEP